MTKPTIGTQIIALTHNCINSSKSPTIMSMTENADPQA
jgi:hypothetical protein